MLHAKVKKVLGVGIKANIGIINQQILERSMPEEREKVGERMHA